MNAFRLTSFFAVVIFCPLAHSAVVVTSLEIPLEIREDFWGRLDPVDVDGNGTIDFTFGSESSSVALRTEGANRAIIRLYAPPNSGRPLTPVPTGFEISSTLADTDDFSPLWASADFLGGHVELGENSFLGIVIVMSTGSASDFNGRGVIGIEFEAEDGIHYGYIDISAGPGYAGITLYGWAYESQPGVSILAGQVPESSSAIFVACGTALLVTKRRRERRTNQ